MNGLWTTERALGAHTRRWMSVNLEVGFQLTWQSAGVSVVHLVASRKISHTVRVIECIHYMALDIVA